MDAIIDAAFWDAWAVKLTLEGNVKDEQDRRTLQEEYTLLQARVDHLIYAKMMLEKRSPLDAHVCHKILALL